MGELVGSSILLWEAVKASLATAPWKLHRLEAGGGDDPTEGYDISGLLLILFQLGLVQPAYEIDPSGNPLRTRQGFCHWVLMAMGSSRSGWVKGVMFHHLYISPNLHRALLQPDLNISVLRLFEPAGYPADIDKGRVITEDWLFDMSPMYQGLLLAYLMHPELRDQMTKVPGTTKESVSWRCRMEKSQLRDWTVEASMNVIDPNTPPVAWRPMTGRFLSSYGSWGSDGRFWLPFFVHLLDSTHWVLPMLLPARVESSSILHRAVRGVVTARMVLKSLSPDPTEGLEIAKRDVSW